MADSIVIGNSVDGKKRIALRPAVEPDGAETRYIELYCETSRQAEINTVRGSSAAITTADGADESAWPSELTSNIMDVGDKSCLVVVAEHTASDGEVVITPIIIMDDVSSGSAVEYKSILPSKSTGMGDVAFVNSGVYKSPALIWDLFGAKKVGIHISAIEGTSNGVKIKAGLI